MRGTKSEPNVHVGTGPELFAQLGTALLDGLGLKLQAALPQLSGQPTSVNDSEVLVTMKDAGLLPVGAKIIFYEGVPENSNFGSDPAVLGEARLVSVNGEQLLTAPIEPLSGIPATAVVK